jgi:hypothetical protein
MGPPSHSDRAQGDVLCDELSQQINALDRASLKAIAAVEGLQKKGVPHSSPRAGRLQQQIRELSTERLRLVSMLNAMGHSYPCDHQHESGEAGR